MIDEDQITNIPNDKYAKFFAKFAEIDTIDIKDWRYQHLLGFFVHKYKQHYHTDYQWKFNHQLPTKCFEVWQIKTLGAKLSTSPQILKDYIDWVFINIVPKAKRKLTSISFMTKDDVINDYKLNVLLADQTKTTIDRNMQLPEHYKKAWLEGSGVKIHTYGNLAFIAQIIPRAENITSGFEKLVDAGFNMSILEKIA